MKRHGFTLVEMLTVLAIITILVGLLVPSLTMVRRVAKETKQKAMLASIEVAITAFRNDHGDYPPSWYDVDAPENEGYGGGQKLTEALLGRDLLGFHPLSQFDLADGVYDGTPENLATRRSSYLEATSLTAVSVGSLYARVFGPSFPLHPDSILICDVFGREKVSMPDGTLVKAGAPVLYYKANPNSRIYNGVAPAEDRIYDMWDNIDIIGAQFALTLQQQPLQQLDFFYGNPPTIPFGYIQDPTVTAMQWPHRPDSYLLVTAGYDGIYGTADDITNFGP